MLFFAPSIAACIDLYVVGPSTSKLTLLPVINGLPRISSTCARCRSKMFVLGAPFLSESRIALLSETESAPRGPFICTGRFVCQVLSGNGKELQPASNTRDTANTNFCAIASLFDSATQLIERSLTGGFGRKVERRFPYLPQFNISCSEATVRW